jgi:hypothetical protein
VSADLIFPIYCHNDIPHLVKSVVEKGCKFSLYALKFIGVSNNNNNNNKLDTLITNKAYNAVECKHKKGARLYWQFFKETVLIQKHVSEILDAHQTTQHTENQLHKNVKLVIS